MPFFKQKSESPSSPRTQEPVSQRLVFASTKSLEVALDGSDKTFARYCFALYQCSPDEDAGINNLRAQLRDKHPLCVTKVGKYFVLSGEPAYIALTSYYQALAQADALSDEYKDYVTNRIQEIERIFTIAKGLPNPIDLTEGQLANDPQLELMTCIALLKGQVVAA